MSRFDITDEQLAVWRRQMHELAQSALPGEEIVIAAPFRRGGAAASTIASKGLGGLAYAGVGLVRKKKAGGLPQQALLVLTPDRLHAFKYKTKYSKRQARYEIGDEVAVWDRAGVRASTEKKMGMTQLTIESPAEGEKVTLVGASVKDDALSLEFMETLKGAESPR